MDAARLVLEALKAVLSLAQAAFRAAQGVLEFTGKALDAASDFLEFTKDAISAVANVAVSVLEFGLDNVLNIRKVHLEQRLSATKGLTFAASVEMTIIGIDVNWSVKLTLDNPIKLIEDIVDFIKDKATGGIGRKKRDSSPYSREPTTNKMLTKVQK